MNFPITTLTPKPKLLGWLQKLDIDYMLLLAGAYWIFFVIVIITDYRL